MEYHFEPLLRIRPDRFTAYSVCLNPNRTNHTQKLLGDQLRTHSTGNSLKTIKRVRDCINCLAYTATTKTVYSQKENKRFHYKLTFLTLTLPHKQDHTDKEIIRKPLSNFLNNWAKRRKGLLYIWKAEVADNGNIHFHITANAFYHHKKLREDWNRIIDKLDYVKKSGIHNPNSTDVHSVKNVKNIAAYLTSYFTKKDLYNKKLKRYHKMFGKKLLKEKKESFELPKNYLKNLKRKIEGNNWGASKLLLNNKVVINPFDINVHENHTKILREAENWKSYDYCSIYRKDGGALKGNKQFENIYRNSLNRIMEAQFRIDRNQIVESFFN